MNHPTAYRKSALYAAAFFLSACVTACSYHPNVSGPFNIHLIVAEDASHGMVVNYHTLPPDTESAVQYDTVSHQGAAGKYAMHAEAKPQAFTYIPDQRMLHSITLKGLKPGETYYFIVGNAKSGYSHEHKFRALPESSDGLRFVNGGDMGTSDTARTLLKLSAAKDPAFAIVGGDVSYATRQPKGAKEWDVWFKNWAECMVTPQGFMIPLITAIGNHEINDKAKSPSFEDQSPFYWRFFGGQGPQPYFARTIGDAEFVFLDAGNLVSHEGVQTDWLKAELTKTQALPVKFAIYHQPLYPAYREFDGSEAVAGRKYWAPLFDQFHLTAAFEHHDHVFKRSKPLKANAVDPQGTLYVGDGCWGQKPRSIDEAPRWYLEKSSSTAHFWAVTVTGTSVQFQAIDTSGKVFDQCTLPVAPKQAAPPASAPTAPAAPTPQPEPAVAK